MRTLVLLIFITSALRTQAQTGVYHPFPDSGAVWNIVLARNGGCCNPTGYYTEFYSIIISGDTLINTNNYHKLVIPHVDYFNSDTTGQCYIGPYTSKGSIGFIRQDTLLKRVYFIQNGFNTERLLYDFNLHVGDSANFYCTSNWNLKVHIQNEDSVFIGNNYRKKWFINSTGGSASGGLDSIIEGIGSKTGLINYCRPFDPCITYLNSFLNCFQYGNIIYPSYSTACDIITSTDSKNVNSRVILFPNPFHTTATLEIKNKEFSNAELKIYDRMGRLVQRQIINSPSTTIHRNSLVDGIYFYQLVSDKGQMVGGKFVVE